MMQDSLFQGGPVLLNMPETIHVGCRFRHIDRPLVFSFLSRH